MKLSRLLLSAFLLFVMASTTFANEEAHPYTFTISKHSYRFSDIYQIKSSRKETYPGSIKKSMFRIRTNYDLSNKDGWQATGIMRVFSLGALFHWAIDIDIYDPRGVRIGLIDGDFATLEKAKFNLYAYDDNGQHTLVGVAYASADFLHFVILRDFNDPHPIVELNRVDDNKSNWSVTVHYPDMIDDRIIRIFAGFLVDYEDRFVTPPGLSEN